MLKKLRVKNFKCFREEKEFDFGRITLLLGANSSGKSSVMYAILGAIQSGEFPFQFSPNGKYVNMGDYRDMVWGHDVDREIEIGLEMAGTYEHKLQTKWIANQRGLPELNYLVLNSPFFDSLLNTEIDDFLRIQFLKDVGISESGKGSHFWEYWHEKTVLDMDNCRR